MTQPLIIICETCQAKLRVRSATAIGSILACPKCQSLVHVAPAEPEAAGTTAAPEPEVQTSTQEASTSPVVKLVLIATCLFLVGATGWMLSRHVRFSGESSPAPQSPPARENSPEEPLQPTEASEATEPSHDAQQGTSANEVDPADASQENHVVADSGAADTTLPTVVDQRAASTTEESNDRDPSSTLPEGTDPIGPVGIPDLDDELLPTEPPAEEAHHATDATESPLLATARHATAQASGDPLPAPASSKVRMSIRKVEDLEDLKTGVELPQAMALPIAEAAWENVAPTELVRLISDMTGVAITMTPTAYLVAAKGASQTGTMSRSQITAGELLLATLEPLNLEVIQRRGHLVVAPQGSSSDSSPVEFSQGTPSEELNSRLKESITWSFTEPTRLVDVCRFIERATKLTILVDWATLETVELSPTSRVTTSVVEQPLVQVFEELLPQIGLRWVPVGSHAVWITAQQ